MGTKLECAINPLASNSQNSNSCNFSVHLLDDYFKTRGLKENCQKIGLDRIGSSMESNNMDSIRKTMQMHEDIFKHQVQELHRLYSVQKMLMNEVKREIKKNRLWTSSDINNINQNHLTTQTGYGYNILHVQGDPSSSRERSGSCSTDTMKITQGFDLEIRLAGEDISAEASIVEEDQAQVTPTRMNQMSIQGSDEDTEIELTLSIGGSSSKKTTNKAKPGCLEMGIRDVDSSSWFKSDHDCSVPNTPMSISSTTIDQERKRPHWLLQGLSINKTS